MAKKELLSGNVAMAEAAIRAGCNFFASYPITPQTTLLEYMSTRMYEVDREFIQAESEIGAINMVMGASAAGGRAMTATAGMAVSLMMETLSNLVAGKFPSVVINIQRTGAGAGGIKSSQTDYHYATKSMGHGGLHAYVLSPGDVQEAADLVYDAFAFAEKYSCLVYILTDAMVAQVMEPVELPPMLEGLPVREGAAQGNTTGVAKRINTINRMDLRNLQGYREFEAMYETWKEKAVRYEEYCMEDAEVVLVACGMSARIARGAIDNLRSEGIKVGLFRPITLYPFPTAQIRNFAERGVKAVLTAEVAIPMQMVDDVDAALMGKLPSHRLDCCWTNVFTTEDIEAKLREIAKEV